MVRRTDDAVEDPEAENEAGPDQGVTIRLDPIGFGLRRGRCKPDPFENRFHPPKSDPDCAKIATNSNQTYL